MVNGLALIEHLSGLPTPHSSHSAIQTQTHEYTFVLAGTVRQEHICSHSNGFGLGSFFKGTSTLYSPCALWVCLFCLLLLQLTRLLHLGPRAGDRQKQEGPTEANKCLPKNTVIKNGKTNYQKLRMQRRNTSMWQTHKERLARHRWHVGIDRGDREEK